MRHPCGQAGRPCKQHGHHDKRGRGSGGALRALRATVPCHTHMHQGLPSLHEGGPKNCATKQMNKCVGCWTGFQAQALDASSNTRGDDDSNTRGDDAHSLLHRGCWPQFAWTKRHQPAQCSAYLTWRQPACLDSSLSSHTKLLPPLLSWSCCQPPRGELFGEIPPFFL